MTIAGDISARHSKIKNLMDLSKVSFKFTYIQFEAKRHRSVNISFFSISQEEMRSATVQAFPILMQEGDQQVT